MISLVPWLDVAEAGEIARRLYLQLQEYLPQPAQPRNAHAFQDDPTRVKS
jgi:hypothetical protein